MTDKFISIIHKSHLGTYSVMFIYLLRVASFDKKTTDIFDNMILI